MAPTPSQPSSGPPSSGQLRVVGCDPNLVPHREAMAQALAGVAETTWFDLPTSPGILDALADAEVYVGTRLTAEMCAAAPRLRLVLVGGAGYDGIDLSALPGGVVVANTFNHESSIAEYVVATVVCLRRGLLVQDRALRDGVWHSSVYTPGVPQAPTLAESTVGIVGLGHIGGAVWQAFRALGASGCAVTRTVPASAPDGMDWVGGLDRLDDLLGASDVVVLCLPLNDSTRGMIGSDQLAAMRPDAVLVNVARGPVVDEDALYRALTDRRIGGAVVDVWYQYPTDGDTQQPSAHDLGRLDNVIMTPHISGVTSTTFTRRAQDIADNIRRFRAGEPVQRVVHPAPGPETRR